MKKNWFKTKKASSWDRLCDHMDDYLSQSNERWSFRGQGSNKPLTTKIERLGDLFQIRANRLPNYEWKIVREFRRRAHIYDPNPPKEHLHAEWLALLRHHEGPTRLIDFTYSPFVAIHFALEMAGKDKNSVIWAINMKWISENAKRVVGDTIYDAYSVERDGEPFEEMFLKNKFLFAGAVNPKRLNERLAVQQGVFLCPGNIKHSFEDNLRSREKPTTLRNRIHKIVISRQCRSEVLARLRKMNIDRTSLFGGLDGFAQSLNTRFKEIGELNVIEKCKWPKEPAG